MTEERLQYISLQEATKYCDYSQEYLSLRIRQGKLRGKKFARNWVTKKEWLEEYLKEVRDYNCNSVKNGFHYRHRENFIRATKKDSIVQDGLIIAQEFIKEKKLFEFEFPLKKFSTAMLAVIFLSVFAVSFFAPSFFQKRELEQEVATISAGSVFESTSEIFLDYGKWLSDIFNRQIVRAKTYFAYLKNFDKNHLAEKENSGMVVVPSTQNDDALKEKIKNSFSDEIKVELTNEGSGIITRLFKEREGSQYLYIMVPVNN
jgi:hypothetical protein